MSIAGVALLSFTLGACDLALSGFREQARETWTKSYPLSAGGRVEIVNTNGFIRVEGGSGSTVEVRADRIARGSTEEAAKKALEDLTIREEISADRVHLETRYPKTSGFGRASLSVEYTVRVPADVHVDLQGTNGQVTAIGITRGARLQTTNGGIEGRRLSGEVQASTTNGGIELDLAAVTDPVRVTTTNGGVTVTVPSDAKADVRAECTNGGIDVDGLNLDLEGERSRRRVSGRLNGGGHRLEVRTTNGGIKIDAKAGGSRPAAVER